MLAQPDSLPVNRLFLLYSAHILVCQVPEAGLSRNKLSKLTACKRLAKRSLPEVERTTVAVWAVGHKKLDCHSLGYGPVRIETQPTIRLRIYPDIRDLEMPFDHLHLSEDVAVIQRMLLGFMREIALHHRSLSESIREPRRLRFAQHW